MRRLRDHLTEELFLYSPRERWRLSPWEAVLVVASLLAIAVVAQIARLGWSVSSGVLWAEDGAVYLGHALNQDFIQAVTQTYNSYLVFVPNLVAEAATLVPLRDAPLMVSLVSAAVVGVTGIAVWFGTSAYIRNPYLRGMLVVLTVLAPFAGIESQNSGAYVPWYMLFGCFCLLLWRPAGWGGAAFAATFIAFTGLSTPGVLFFLPLVLLRVIAVRDARDVAILAGWGIGALAQIPVLLLSKEVVVKPAWDHHIPIDYVQRVPTEAIFGLRLGGDLWIAFGWVLPVAIALVAAGGLVWGMRRANATARWLAGVAVLVSVVMFVASIYQRGLGLETLWPGGGYNELQSRYVIVPALLLVLAAMVLLEAADVRSPGNGWFRWAAGGAVAVLLISVGVSFWTRELGVRGIPWKPAVEAAAVKCEASGSPGLLIDQAPPGWSIYVPCEDLTSG